MHRVVITGIGTVNPIGNNIFETTEGLRQGKCGIGELNRFDSKNFKCKLAGQVDIDITQYLSRKDIRRTDRFSQLGMISANEAIADSGLCDYEINLSRSSVVMATGMGGLITMEEEFLSGLTDDFNYVKPFLIPMISPNMLASNIATAYQFTGGSLTISASCAGGLYAIGEGYRRIKDGYMEIGVCGGSDALITPLAIGGFTSMAALNCTKEVKRASIPFDKERDGFIVGEGAACVVLEEREHALRRNANVYAEVIGYGESCDAYHMTMPCKDGQGMITAMKHALVDADIKAKEIDMIHAHGTSTRLNDNCESKAISKVFGKGKNQPFIWASKSMTGHLLSAASAVSVVLSILAMKEKFIPATINIQEVDPECDVNLILEKMPYNLKKVMINAFGFGGQNASIVLNQE